MYNPSNLSGAPVNVLVERMSLISREDPFITRAFEYCDRRVNDVTVSLTAMIQPARMTAAHLAASIKWLKI
jgi:hypothetical protein